MALYEEQFAFKSKKTTPRNTILHSFITLILCQTTKQNRGQRLNQIKTIGAYEMEIHFNCRTAGRKGMGYV